MSGNEKANKYERGPIRAEDPLHISNLLTSDAKSLIKAKVQRAWQELPKEKLK